MTVSLNDADKFAVIVGAGRGIGKAIALNLSAEGYNTFLVSRHFAELVDTAREARLSNLVSLPIAADITNEESVISMYKEVEQYTTKIDVLVNSAGAAFLGSVLQNSPAIFQNMVDVNLVGVYRTIYHGLKLLKTGNGLVVNIISRAARQPYADALSYGSAKAGLVYLTRALSVALSSDGIRVIGVSPGAVATELRKRLFPDENEEFLLKSSDIAAIVSALLAKSFKHLNGCVIDVPW